jgi:hypothetical protein
MDVLGVVRHYNILNQITTIIIIIVVIVAFPIVIIVIFIVIIIITFAAAATTAAGVFVFGVFYFICFVFQGERRGTSCN